MAPIDTSTPWPLLHRAARTVVVIDVVESVRLMEQNQDDVIRRWLGFVGEVQSTLLPRYGGRLVKSLGDGLMLEFEATPHAIQCAIAMQNLMSSVNQGRTAEQCMWLRIGAHVADVVADERDIYGAGVNLAARIAALAGPGEIVVSADVRDRLSPGLDAELDDLGECYLKHVSEPVRAYRVGSPGDHPVVASRESYAVTLQPTIAVIPFAARTADTRYFSVGELIADGVIGLLSHARHLRVISRLSSTAFRGRDTDLSAVEAHLGATYVLSGGYGAVDDRLTVTWELADARTHQVVDTGRMRASVAELLDLDGDLTHAIATGVHDAIVRREVLRAQTQPLPTLESYSLMLGGIQLLHRSSRRDFDLSFKLFNHLTETHPRCIEPRIWQAKWYALRAVQGLSTDVRRDTQAALACTAHALEREPGNSFAMAMQGFVHCHLSRDYDAARVCLSQSVETNPSETFGHLFSGVIDGLLGHFDAGLASYELAAATSPLDPARYLLDSIGSYLYLGAGQHDKAITLAQQSLRLNRLHAHTWRILTVAQVETGNMTAAQQSLGSVLAIQPDLTTHDDASSPPSMKAMGESTMEGDTRGE